MLINPVLLNDLKCPSGARAVSINYTRYMCIYFIVRINIYAVICNQFVCLFCSLPVDIYREKINYFSISASLSKSSP